MMFFQDGYWIHFGQFSYNIEGVETVIFIVYLFVGLRDEQVDAILSEHNNNVESLEARQNQQYAQQDENLKVSTSLDPPKIFLSFTWNNHANKGCFQGFC